MEHEYPPRCTCGHLWEEHHHGYIMNPAYLHVADAHEYGFCGAMAAQECERTELNGVRRRMNEPECPCGGYVNSKTRLSMGDAVKDKK